MFVSNHIKSFNELICSSIFSLLRRLQDYENPLFVNYFYTDIHFRSPILFFKRSTEYQRPIYIYIYILYIGPICFIDYSKAFDCVDHPTYMMEEMDIPEHMVQVMMSLYANQEAKVRTEYGDSESFSIGKGVRQGCVLSPYLFNLYSEYIMR